MADPQPVYEGVIGDDGHTRMCKCSDLASYSVTTDFQGKRQTFDVCTEHFRFLNRRNSAHTGRNRPYPVAYTHFPEHESFQVRTRVWVKRNV